MTSANPPEIVRAFFESYCHAFEQFDAPAIADHFAFPAHVTAESSEIGLTPITDRRAWIDQLDHLLARYRAINLVSAHVVELRFAELSPRLSQATVLWGMDDSAARRLYHFGAMYTLAEIGNALRITAIAHDEILRYRECVARLRAEGAGTRSDPGTAV